MAFPGDAFRKYLRFSSIGIELGLGVGLGVAIGLWLDARFGTRPWLLLAFAALGMAAGFRSVYLSLMKLREEMRARTKDGQGDPP